MTGLLGRWRLFIRKSKFDKLIDKIQLETDEDHEHENVKYFNSNYLDYNNKPKQKDQRQMGSLKFKLKRIKVSTGVEHNETCYENTNRSPTITQAKFILPHKRYSRLCESKLGDHNKTHTLNMQAHDSIHKKRSNELNSSSQVRLFRQKLESLASELRQSKHSDERKPNKLDQMEIMHSESIVYDENYIFAFDNLAMIRTFSNQRSAPLSISTNFTNQLDCQQ